MFKGHARNISYLKVSDLSSFVMAEVKYPTLLDI